MPASPSASGPPPAALGLWCAALFTLPWVGADLIILSTGRDAGAGLQPSWLLIAGAWLAAGRPRREWSLPAAWCRAALLAGGAVIVSAAGLFVAPAPTGLDLALLRYLKQTLQLLVMAMFMAWPVVHLVGVRAWQRTAQWLVAGALLQAAYGTLQQASGSEPLPLLAMLDTVFTSNPSILSGSTMLYVGDRFVDVPRLRGTACEPLYLGNYLLLALPMVALTGWRRRWRLAAGLTLGLLLFLTWSRGAWLGAGAALTVAAWWGWDGDAPTPRARWRRWRRPLTGIAGLAGLALLALVAGWEEAGLPLRRLAQSFSQHDWSNLTRLYSLQAAWRAWLLSPVVGIGWGQFGWHFPALVDPTGLQAMFTWPVVANFPLLVLCETGLVGAAALTWAVGGLARGARRARRELHAAGRRRVGVCAMAATGIAVQTLTFSQYNLAHAWVALGLLATALLEARVAGESG